MSLFAPPAHQTQVPFDGSFQLSAAPTRMPDAPPKKQCKAKLKGEVAKLRELQERLEAEDRRALLLVFQALDAAGKDGTIRAALSGINPAGIEAHRFGRPSEADLAHDFLWRVSQRLPSRGKIGVFNRSHYEEVLVVRVFPELLEPQRLPPIAGERWENRFEAIRSFEEHVARSGTVILKFFLNVSFEEQTQRQLARLDDPAKQWKFDASDLEMRDHWGAFAHAYEAALRATSRPHAPWYCIPADHKPQMRAQVAEIIRQTLEAMSPQFPALEEGERDAFIAHRARLLAQRVE